MQDRFKFRMYDTNVNKMYMPNDFEEVESIYECIKQQINWDLDVDYDIKFNHLENGRFFMQCTGLKDKNGKLIYEGDIVRLFCNEFENIHTVKFGDFAMYSLDLQTEYEKGSTAVYGYYLGGLKYPIPLSISLDTSRMQIEVIGNIYENPELLEKGGAN